MFSSKNRRLLLLLPLLILFSLKPWLFPFRKLDCANKLRLGDAYGGWYICTPPASLRNRLVYTVGIGRNIEWDKAMIEKFGTVHHGWDPTPTAKDFFDKRAPPKNFIFHEYGLGARDGNVTLKLPEGNQDSYTVMEYSNKAQEGTITSVKMLTVGSMMREAGHVGKRLFVLKIDIEGAEFDVIDKWAKSESLLPTEQVLIEFHARYFADGRTRVNEALEKMNEIGFELAHKTDWEYTFVRKDLVSLNL